MRELVNSDIYALYDKQANLTSKKIAILAGSSSVQIVNNELEELLTIVKKQFKSYDSAITNAVDATMRGDIVLFYSTTPELNISTCLPFFKYKKSTSTKIAINVTPYLKITTTREGDEKYEMDVVKLYALLNPAYYYLVLFTPNCVLPVEVMSITSRIWSYMFTNVLAQTLGIMSSTDKMETFKYFASKFYLLYLLETTNDLAESIAIKFLKNGKTPMMESVEIKCENKHINLYESFSTFCTTLFNDDITKIRTFSGKNSLTNLNQLNLSMYLKKFLTLYHQPSLMALGAFPYFYAVIFGIYKFARICSSRPFEEIIKESQRDFITMINFLEGEIK